MRVEHHQLFEEDGTPVPFVASPNAGDGQDARYLILHYTAALTLRSTVGWFLEPQASASAHIIIDRNGDVVQMVPLNGRAWHAGVSRWGGLENLNAHSIGIELVNAGALERTPACGWCDYAANVIPIEEVVVARHKHESQRRGWHAFPAVQIARALEVARALHARYRFLDVLGHDDVAPGRKIDPGPAFPMRRFVQRLFDHQALPAFGGHHGQR